MLTNYYTTNTSYLDFDGGVTAGLWLGPATGLGDRERAGGAVAGPRLPEAGAGGGTGLAGGAAGGVAGGAAGGAPGVAGG